MSLMRIAVALLFPAPAGVILTEIFWIESRISVPRTRGGDPGHTIAGVTGSYCSPHPRG